MSTGVAYLDNIGDITLFKFGDSCIKFKSPKTLKKYLRVKYWDSGYIVCDALYGEPGIETEEYIDLLPILDNLYIDAEDFLKDVEEVKIAAHNGD